MRTTILTSLLLFIFSLTVFAQNGKYGATPEDSVKCVENLSLYMNPYFKNGKYKEAVKYWRVCFNTCPKSSKNLYINGAKMYDKFIEEAPDDATKEAYIDTLMMIYDQRIESYGEEGKVLEMKGTDMIKLRGDNPKAAYEVLKKAWDLNGNDMGPGGAVYTYKAHFEMLRKKEATKAELIEEYGPLSEVVEYNIAKYKKEGNEKYASYWEKSAINIEKMFIAIADCEELINVFQPKFEATPDDTLLLKAIIKFLSKKDCMEEQLFEDAAAKMCSIKPSYDCSMALGKLLSKKDNYTEAYTYFKQATELARTDEEKVDANFIAAQAAYNLKRLSSVRTHCQSILAVNPNYGEAYLLIGDAYSASSSQCKRRKK
eukprot:gnl/MRDRNA2_/MRDRNA2_261013_c0_seq1.p1 gnl/MRDRNA2_/MRDRNA2_261013_c0~~gnl/MRDRNA2_/MRDRNA2_261013_c0_seq1.p1  ORF type:complete len:372 (+),score=13.38 gnl/MRDRNA2_/MRDRNA2_261013_c0_seq1:292-1407(+)